MKNAIRSLLACIVSISLLTHVEGAFVKIEDFETHTVGADVDTAKGWVSADGAATNPVVLDPIGSTNKVLVVQNDTSANVRLNSTANAALSIPNNTTATLFLRFRFNGQKNYSFGMSDVSAPSAFGDFESQFNHNNAANDARMRDSGSFLPMSPASPLLPGQWYNIWMVINNTTDRTTVYLDATTPPGGTTSALQSNGAKTAFTFRNGTASNALAAFFIQTGGGGGADEGHTGAVYIDDIWIDTAGQNLTNPAPPTINVVSAANDEAEVGIGGAIGFDPTLNDTTTLGSIDRTTLEIVTPPVNGTATVDPVSRKIVYRHTGTTAGTDSFRYRVSNASGASGEADVQVTINGALRLANKTVNMPLDPPASAGALQLVDAFPGLTFDGMVSLASVPGAPNQLLVATAHGSSTGSDSKVWMIPDTAAAAPVKRELFEVDSLCPAPFTRGRGIYSVVCHPDFATNGRLIVCYQGKPDGFPVPVNQIPNLQKNGVPNTTIECTLRVSEFTISPANLAILLNPSSTTTQLNTVRAEILASEKRHINLAEQHLYHSINDSHFGADGYLYVSFGDEGDQAEPYRNAQYITKDQYSSIIRIDVDKRPGNLEPNPHYAVVIDSGTGKANFSVPADNPFVGDNVTFNGTTYTPAHPDFGKIRTEIWAVGLRNPFKFHLDDNNGVTEAWVGDVGMDLWEEVTLVRNGDNAGWSYWEGTHASGIAHALQPTAHKAPEWDYGHSSGNNCVIGGVLYRGTAYTAPLNGKYVFGDHGSGRLWTLDPNGSGAGKVQDLGVGTVSLVVDFHVDPLTGHILIAQYQSSKKIYRLKEGAPVNDNFPQLLSQTGAFADLATLTPNPGVVPYEPNLKFWSDHADKARWFVIKNTTDQMGYSRDGAWTFPTGMIFIKHFDMELNRAFPGTNRKRLETRFLVRNEEGTYGVSYRWNDQETDATLVSISGEDFDLPVRIGGTNNGGTVTGGTIINQSWHIPSRGECLTCHNPTAGHALSVTTQQLNKFGQLGQETGNYLDLLSQSGYLADFNDSQASLKRYYRPDEVGVSLEERVRSYVAVNCSYCHQPNTGIVESWDARGHLTVEQMRLLYGLPVSETYHDANDRLIIPGDKANSLLWNRIQARNVIGNGTHNGYSQMPPLATNVVDDVGVQLLTQWIELHANVGPTIAAQTPASVNVTENATVGTAVAAVSATDPDVRGGSADNNLLTYTITGGNPGGLFSINPQTGQLSVNGILDFEAGAQHQLQIAVTDNFAVNPKSTTHALTVNVQDVAIEDANGNGIPDWWESQYTLTLSPGGDHDRDGVPDFFEFLSGSDPEQPDSASTVGPRIVDHVTSPVPGYRVAWRVRNGMALGQQYFAQSAGSLSGPWTALQAADYEVVSVTPVAPGISELVIFVPSNGGASFFRLRNTAE